MTMYTDPQTGEQHEVGADGGSSSTPFLVLIAFCVGGVLLAWMLFANPASVDAVASAGAPILQPHAPPAQTPASRTTP